MSSGKILLVIQAVHNILKGKDSLTNRQKNMLRNDREYLKNISKHLKNLKKISIWVFFHEHSRFTGQQGKEEGIYLSPLYHFHPLHRHLDISQAITAESSPLHIGGSRTRTGNLWFPSASR